MKRTSLIILLVALTCMQLWAESKGRDFLLSLVVPGSSQIISGRQYGYAMVASELSIIGSMFYLNNESKALTQDSYEYAIKFAHLNPGEYNSEFYNNLARYESNGFDAGGYNAWVRKTAMEQFPNSPQQQQDFIDLYSYGDDRYWSWDNPANRSEYNRIRNRSSDFNDYALVAGGVLILNHLVSGIDVLRYSAEAKRNPVSFGLKGKTPLLQLSYEW